MLQNNFFSIKDKTDIENGYIYTIELIKSHTVYQGHFAGNPVTPGACLMQIIKELTEDALGKSLFIDEIKNAKFLYVINPADFPLVDVHIVFKEQEKGLVSVSTVLKKDSTIFGKTIILFKEVEKTNLTCVN
jgi:3-hydroxyacyl-[acyl-carrier-protein] dehydratase